MRKSYLPRPSGIPGADNPRRVLSTVPLEIDLARSSSRFYCWQLQEPELLFGGGHGCVDPRTGLAAYGPYGLARPEDTGQVRVGIVGTPEAIDKTLKLLDEISRPIEQSANFDCVQHPSFPGLNSQEPFRIHIVTQRQWYRPLHQKDFRAINECRDAGTRRWLLQELFGGEVRAISELEYPPQVILCAVSDAIMHFLKAANPNDDFRTASNNPIRWGPEKPAMPAELREFGTGLKAECMMSLPTEIIWHHENSTIVGMEDRATPTWNLSLSLLHKAGLAPWRPKNAAKDSCYIGISFYRRAQQESFHILKTFAHVVTELGEGCVVEGPALEWNPSQEGNKTPHLDESQANKLLFDAIAAFEKTAGSSPRKVVVHKSTSYSEAERRGFENALRDVPQFALMTIGGRGIFFMRPGRKPILRGTAIPFDEKLGLVFTSGYLPFLRGHSGNKMPQPLEIIENWGSISFQQAARDLIFLTKLNLNSCEFAAGLPVTLSRCQEIGEVLQALGRREPATDDRHYF
jgi:hypothetical protein